MGTRVFIASISTAGFISRWGYTTSSCLYDSHPQWVTETDPSPDYSVFGERGRLKKNV
jgi:hypothetical protein